MTPFEDFHRRITGLMDSDAGIQLGNLYPNHRLYKHLTDLYDATNFMRSRYGNQGPKESWNRPSRSPGSAFSGSSPSNTSRPSTPINVGGNGNGSLHPNWPNTPPRTPETFPGSWDPLSKVKELKVENEKLKRRRDDLIEDLKKSKDECKGYAAANKRKLELEKQIEVHGATIERLRKRAASAFLQLEQYGSAASEYEQLSYMKNDEKRLMSDLKDEERRQLAEDEEMYYKLQQGKALANSEQYARAENILLSVLESRRNLDNQRAKAVDAYEVQSTLCNVLCSQGKSTEAKQLYLAAAAPLQLGTLDTRYPAACAWALQNAMSYARLLVREAKEISVKTAVSWVKLIWQNRCTATDTGLHELETEVLEIVTDLEEAGETKQLFRLLEKVCDDDGTPVASDAVVHCRAKLGLILHSRGKPDLERPKDLDRHDHAKAAQYLQHAWTERQRLDVGVARNAAWALALSLVFLKKYKEAENVLVELQQNRANRTKPIAPSSDEITALVAYIQLMLKDYARSEASARSVVDRYGMKNILAKDFSYYHPLDTLIQGLSKPKTLLEETRKRFEEAEAIWVPIYKAREDILARDRSGKAQMQYHIKAAKMLIDECEASAKKRNIKSDRAKRIRAQIVEIEKKMKS